MKRMGSFLRGLTSSLGLLAGLGCVVLAIAEPLVIIGSRQPYLIQPIIDIFQAETKIQIDYRYFEASDLLSQLKSENHRSPADLLLTADVGMIIEVMNTGFLQPTSSPVLSTLIPPSFRDSHHHWFGLSLRARVIVYSPERFQPATDLSYDDLALPQFRGRLCMRSLNYIYNQSLIAALLEHWGAGKTRKWVKGITENLARPPIGGDRDQIRAIANGECDLALVNTYYYAGMLVSNDAQQRIQAKKVALLWPNNGAGVHVNISVGAVLKSAKHPEWAVKFLEFLIRSHTQRLFAVLNYEYPIIIGVPVSDVLLEMGPFKADNLPLVRLGQQRNVVNRIIKEAGFQ